MGVFVEEWRGDYGSPYLVVPDETVGASGTLVEDGDDLDAHHGERSDGTKLAFVDGVRRVEATLYEVAEDKSIARGVAGAHACGAVVAAPGEVPRFTSVSVTRHVIFGSGRSAVLPAVEGGWAWRASSIDDEDPDAPMLELQRRMRVAEGLLAEQLCAEGWLTVVDGPLSRVRSAELPVVGYVKTHHRPLLDPAVHARIPDLLEVGHRTSLFAHADRYSCYVRLATPDRYAGPWSGIVRLEIPKSVGLAQAATRAGAVTGVLPRYAGIRHRDPRAPQNLQPVGALEKHLRHLLGPPGLAERAVRDAIARE